MKVRVRLFGALSERAGTAEEVLDLAEGATAGDVIDAVRERHAGTAGLLARVSVAVNLETAAPGHPLSEDDEVALLPPVAGGEAGDVRITVGLREGSPAVEEALSAVAASGVGGTVVFLGSVRGRSSIGEVSRLEYSAYREMAEVELRRVAEEAAERWPLLGVAILHGVGDLAVGDRTVLVACSAPHRGVAFEACRYAIDEVKRRVQIWKKEVGPAGERWVGLEEDEHGAHGSAPSGAPPPRP